MTKDTPFVVSVRYREVTQPQPYCSQEAEVSAQYAIAEDADAEKAIAGGLAMVKRQTRIALDLETGTVTAVSTTGDVPPRRGRPPKDKTVEEKLVEQKAAEEVKQAAEGPKEDPKPEPTSDDDFGDTTEEKPKEITDADIQAACRAAVADGKGQVLAADVKNMARLKYGTDKVVAIKQNERAGFLADLKNLVAEKTKK